MRKADQKFLDWLMADARERIATIVMEGDLAVKKLIEEGEMLRTGIAELRAAEATMGRGKNDLPEGTVSSGAKGEGEAIDPKV